jgi:hypothetical protein
MHPREPADAVAGSAIPAQFHVMHLVPRATKNF